MTTFQRIIAGLLAVFVVLVGVLVVMSLPEPPGGGAESVPAEEIRPGRLEDLVQGALPSIVTVEVERYDGQESHGTGFVIDERGIVATSLHVLERASRVTVRPHQGFSVPIENMLGADPEGDLALLAVPRRDLPALELRFEPPVQAGEQVLVIGHSLGLSETVSDGLVSAVRGPDDLRVIQTSAPISPGNSGGPMLDREGRVVGVVRSKVVGFGAEGLAFAVGARRLAELASGATPFSVADWTEGRVRVRRTGGDVVQEVAERGDLTGTWHDPSAPKTLIAIEHEDDVVAVTLLALGDRAPRNERELGWGDPTLRIQSRDEVELAWDEDGLLRGVDEVKWTCNWRGGTSYCELEESWVLRPLQGRLLGEWRFPDVPDDLDPDFNAACRTCEVDRPPRLLPVAWERISASVP